MKYNELVEIDRIYAHFRDEVTWGSGKSCEPTQHYATHCA